MNEVRQKAHEVVTHMLGAGFAAGIEKHAASEAFGSELARLALDYCFGSVWSRPGLDARSRSIATIAVLIALRLNDELKNHLRAGLANGLTPTEIDELITHVAVYVGLPSAAPAMGAAVEVLREKGLMPDALSPKERGVL